MTPSSSGGSDKPDTSRLVEAVRATEFREHGWAHLDRIRDHLADMPRDRQDAAIAEIALRQGAMLIPEVNQKALTPSQRAAALHIGGEDKHMLMLAKGFEEPTPAPEPSQARTGLSDREFAQLQMHRDAHLSSRQKPQAAALTKRINAELERRKSGSGSFSGTLTKPAGLVDNASVASAYQKLADRQGDWVSLVDLRKELGTPSDEELAKVIKTMSRAGHAHLAPNPDRKNLTAAERAASIRAGGEDNHLLVIERH